MLAKQSVLSIRGLPGLQRRIYRTWNRNAQRLEALRSRLPQNLIPGHAGSEERQVLLLIIFQTPPTEKLGFSLAPKELWTRFRGRGAAGIVAGLSAPPYSSSGSRFGRGRAEIAWQAAF